MIVINITYTQPLSVVDQYIDQHKAFLTQAYDDGVFLVSGPKQPREGGIIIANLSLEQARELIQEDPFFQNGVADYQLTAFTPTRQNAAALK